ncbi:MAG: hypothetical protein M3Q10_12355 [Chloroflexota bacterium]|nr:hypothetical protein [Chloroflexota bacterium]
MKPPPERRCGARTRDGDPCKNWGIPPSGHCRMHGGRSPRWFASPRYVHGRYSPYGFEAALAREERQRAMAQARAERIVAAERAQREARGARNLRRRSAVFVSADLIEVIGDVVETDSA